MAVGSFNQSLLNYSRYVVEGDLAFQERSHRDLVGSIQGDRLRSAESGRLVSQAQAWELIQVGRGEVQPFQVKNVELQVAFDAVRISKRVKNRQAHVGHGKLRQDAAVVELDHRMNGGLRMNDDFH